MSYDIVKNIKIREGKVFITSASNNVIPRTPHEWECPSLTTLLQAEGREKVDIALMEDYESGNMQGGSNKYTRALEVLFHMPEYAEFNWRGDWDISEKNRTERKDEFHALLLKALKTRLPSDKFVITKNVYGKTAYFNHRKNGKTAKWYYDEKKATVFKYLSDAENIKKSFTMFNKISEWKIKKLA